MALHNLNNVTIEGPAWSARARVHHLDDPAQPGGGAASTSAALRALFVESVDPRRLYEPGTVLALCAATHVDIKLEGETYQWRRPIGLPIPGTGLSPDGIAAAVRDGILSLLLLERGERDDTFTCLAGEIGLRGVEDQPGLRALYGDIDLEEQPEAALTGRRGAARLPGMIAVHASGLSILGRIALPWQPDLLPGVFRLTPAFATGLPGGSANRLLVELDRLMPEERRALLGAWRALGRSLNPRNPAHAAGGLARKPAPVWVTLDVADPASLPHLSWEITPGEPVEGSAHFRGDLLLAPGEVTLALSDQHPNDVQHPPTSLAYVHLADVRLRAVGGALQVEVNTGPEPGPDAGAGVPGIELRYVADLEAGAAGWHERFALAVEDPDDAGAPAGTGAAFAFDPVGVPRVLRRQQRLPLPVWEPPGRREEEEEEPEPVDPAVVWGFMPVDGGWAQLPVPNLTEQMYVDTGLAQLGAHLSSSPADGVRGAAKRTPFRGAVAYGNQPPAQAAVESGPVGRPQGPAVAEQLWSLTITGARHVAGTWVLDGSGESSVRLRIAGPDLILDGLFWLSTGRPTAADALPNLDDWLGGLRSISLRLARPGLPFALPRASAAGRDLLDRLDLGTTTGEAVDLSFLAGLFEESEIAPPPGMVAVEVVDPFSLAPLPEGAGGADDRAWRLVESGGGRTFLVREEGKDLHVYTVGADLYGSLARLLLGGLAFELEPGDGEAPYASLGAWSWTYRIAPKPLARMVTVGLLPADAFDRHLPFVWQRHATLPMVQNLPLTQSQSPPNHPSASRQLLPFELGDGARQGWAFRGEGAGSWPVPAAGTTVRPALLSQPDLGLAALSLPGLVIDPSTAVETQRTVDALPKLYRYDLPYADELNALAQLPEPSVDPGLVSPLPDDPPPEPVRPLARETFAGHWQRLSERASLAALDAARAVGEGETSVENLVQPFSWPVAAEFDLDAHPGQLRLTQEGGGGLILARESALEGISGRFAEDGGKLHLQPDGSYRVLAGSMAAHADGQGAIRDQRGLARRATVVAGDLLRTPLALDLSADAPQHAPAIDELVSATTALSLAVGSQVWHFWFRDLPATGGAFTPIRSRVAEDVNDPEALSLWYDHVQGYEWRLYDGETATPGAGVEAVRPLVLNGLHFYPLALPRVDFTAEGVARIEVVGRLQLPLSGPDGAAPELTMINNAVRLTFEPAGAGEDAAPGMVLAHVAPEPDAEGRAIVTWPLQLGDDGELTSAPRLVWARDEAQGVNVALYDRTDATLTLQEARFEFFWLGRAWALPVDGDVVFGPDPAPLELAIRVPSQPAEAQIFVGGARVALDPVLRKHSAHATLEVCLRPEPAASACDAPEGRRIFGARIDSDLLLGSVHWEEARFFDLPVMLRADAAGLAHDSLQVGWHAFAPVSADRGLLPGRSLGDALADEVPGYVALTFEAPPGGAGGAWWRMRLTSAFVEALLTARWGDFLQEPPVPEAGGEEARVFGSSAGDVTAGYSALWQPDGDTQQGGGWQETMLLNGFLEFKNLFSWPRTLPGGEGGEGAPDSALAHLRHTMRVLLNQHRVPPDLLSFGGDTHLFGLGMGASRDAWQFLAVVEHQVVGVTPAGAPETESDYRWTGVQEVRLLPPALYGEFLAALDDSQDAISDLLADYLDADLRRLIQEALDGLPASTLLVEASAHHWLRHDPLPAGLEPSTHLQFLPGGNQLAIISDAADYAPPVPADGETPVDWSLLTLPFLGRLQAVEPDGTEAGVGLQADPILQIAAGSASSLARALAGWRHPAGTDMPVPALETLQGRTWPRLDPASLEENWFRLQHPAPELPLDLQSVTAARPESAARLSRAAALRQLFDPFRAAYPPAEEPAFGGQTDAADALPVAAFKNRRFRGAEPGAGHPLADVGTVNLNHLSRPQHAPRHWRVLAMADKNRLYRYRDDTGGYSRQPAAQQLAQAGFHDQKPGQPFSASNLVLTAVGESMPGNDPQQAFLIYNDNKPHGRAWVKIGQKLRFDRAGTYRLSVSILPIHYRDNQVPHAAASQARLFAGGTNAPIVNLETFQWQRLEWAFDVADAGDQYVGVELFGSRDDLLRNGWYLDLAELAALRVVRPADELTWRQDSLLLMPGPEPATLFGRHWHALAARLPARLAGDGQPGRMVAATALPARLQAQRYLFSLPVRGMVPVAGSGELRPTDALLDALSAQGLHIDRPEIVAHGPRAWLLLGDQDPVYLIRLGGSALDVYLAEVAMPMPVSLAVSPYLGLAFRRATGDDLTLQLASVELLCLDPVSAQLRPVTGRIWTVQPSAAEEAGQPRDEDELVAQAQRWAQAVHRSLTPDSPLAVLRFRLIDSRKPADGDETAVALLRVRYRLEIVRDLYRPAQLAHRAFPLRAPVEDLRFREGQFGPQRPVEGLRPFEVAPPQTTDAQPLRGRRDGWPWGLSALRVDVRYAAGEAAGGRGKAGAVGPREPADGVVWWQALQHLVQFRSALTSNLPAAGLPALFRATAIKSLLPVIPGPALPAALPLADLEGGNGDAAGDLPAEQRPRWQAVLPGALRYLVVGGRPGAMVAIRNQLLRQLWASSRDVLVSGSVPVQHRLPRPVSLPDNDPQRRDKALQPWASYFAPGQNALVTPSPADEAFFAPCAPQGEASPASGGGEPVGARRVRMELVRPHRGEIDSDWDGQLDFDARLGEITRAPSPDGGLLVKVVDADRWRFDLELLAPGGGEGAITAGEPVRHLDLVGTIPGAIPNVGPDGTAGVGPDLRAQLAGVGHALSPAAHWLRVADEWRIVDPVDQRGYVVRPSAAVEGELDVHRILLRFELGAKAREELRAWLSGLEPGAMLAMRAGVAHVDDTSGFAQDLSFLLRVAGSRARPLPLAPAFVLFEDPEYNRALATPSAHATAAVKLEEGGELVIHEVKLSADRRAYNAGSRIALRYDWDDGRASQAHLEVEQVSSGGVVRPLHLDGGAIIAGELLQFALTELKQATDPEPVPADLAAGDLVQFTLILADVAPAPPVVLQVEIVAEPVIPTPEAAYALLRWGAGEGPERVESVRFAWGPEASRVELVCPRDLLAETVRRRAVFLWHDSARPGTVGGYAVQKIARNGSTHFPGVVA